MLDKKVKSRIIAKFKTHANDTGSPQVQIALLTEEIKQLTEHLKTHKKDFSSRRGLLRKVNERRSLLRYLQRENLSAFEDLCQKLKIKVKITQTKADDAAVEAVDSGHGGESGSDEGGDEREKSGGPVV